MKRSEMLHNLKMLLHSTENYTAPVSHYLKVDELAEEILQEIENVGMLPPAIMSGGEEHNQAYFTNVWEPEDE